MFSYAALPLDFGLSAKDTTFTDDEDIDERCFGGDVGDDRFEVCDRFIFFGGGCCGVSVVGEALEIEGR